MALRDLSMLSSVAHRLKYLSLCVSNSNFSVVNGNQLHILLNQAAPSLETLILDGFQTSNLTFALLHMPIPRLKHLELYHSHGRYDDWRMRDLTQIKNALSVMLKSRLHTLSISQILFSDHAGPNSHPNTHLNAESFLKEGNDHLKHTNISFRATEEDGDIAGGFH